MKYVNTYIVSVPEHKKNEYVRIARQFTEIAKDFGAVEIFENWELEVPDGDVTDYRKAVKAEAGERIVLSWVVWPDRETAARAHKEMFTDPRMEDMGEMPFDTKRMILGGFEPIVAYHKDVIDIPSRCLSGSAEQYHGGRRLLSDRSRSAALYACLVRCVRDPRSRADRRWQTGRLGMGTQSVVSPRASRRYWCRRFAVVAGSHMSAHDVGDGAARKSGRRSLYGRVHRALARGNSVLPCTGMGVCRRLYRVRSSDRVLLVLGPAA